MQAETIQKLKAFFLASEHKDRSLPGGGRWFYIPWQKIRDRLDECCSDWECEYGDPIRLPDGETAIRCKIKIEGCTREGVGTSAAAEFNEMGKRKGIGSPISGNVIAV